MRGWSRIVYDLLTPDPHVKSIKVNGEVIWNGSKKEEEMYGMRNEGESSIRSKGGDVRRLSDYDEGPIASSPSSGKDDLPRCGGEVDETTSLHTVSSGAGSLSTTWGR